MKPRRKLNGDETDAFSRRARKWLKWRPGVRKKIKQLYNRKLRRTKDDGC